MQTVLPKIDIIALIEKDSKTRLNRDYQNALVNKIKASFVAEEQQLFVASFYCYLNYNSKTDFVIDFTDVWKWCGFTRKDNAKTLLERHFVEDIDYKVENGEKGFPAIAGKINTEFETRGRPCEKITLTVNTFKKFCMKAGTKKSDQIHDYYIKLEELLQDTLKSQTDELQAQMDALLKSHKRLEENHKRLCYKQNRHKLKKGECFYIVQDTSKLDRVKVGVTKNLNTRLDNYRISFDPTILYTLFSTSYILIENCIKKKYAKNIVQGTEWIGNVPLEELVKSIEHIGTFLGIEYTVYRNENELIEEIDDQETVEITEESESNHEFPDIKKCTKCTQEFPITAFSSDITKKDLVSSICKVCQKESKLAYKNKVRPEITEKSCKICKETKPIVNFSVHLYNKDGYVNSCHTCVATQTNTERKTDKENKIKYKCGLCEKDYTRKDVLQKHIKSSHKE